MHLRSLRRGMAYFLWARTRALSGRTHVRTHATSTRTHTHTHTQTRERERESSRKRGAARAEFARFSHFYCVSNEIRFGMVFGSLALQRLRGDSGRGRRRRWWWWSFICGRRTCLYRLLLQGLQGLQGLRGLQQSVPINIKIALHSSSSRGVTRQSHAIFNSNKQYMCYPTGYVRASLGRAFASND
jgi:hypothetical protein